MRTLGEGFAMGGVGKICHFASGLIHRLRKRDNLRHHSWSRPWVGWLGILRIPRKGSALIMGLLVAGAAMIAARIDLGHCDASNFQTMP